MYEVILTKRAEAELEEQYQWWAENRSTDQANRWYSGFLTKMLSLEQDPHRSASAPENNLFSYQVFQLNYGLSHRPTHRAIYTVVKEKVVILRVRHLRQALLAEEDV